MLYRINLLTWNDRSDQYDRKAEMTKKTGKQERPESWNDWKAGTTGKLERLKSWDDRKA
jgi:hypothetical protein